MKVLVTGGSGFIGSATVKHLLDEGYEVINVDIAPPRFNERYFKLDITDSKAVLQLFETERPQKVLHLAAHVSVPASVQDPLNDMKQNIQGSLSLLEAARQTGVERFVFASSAAIFGDSAVPPISEDVRPVPVSPYGLSKLTVEQYIQCFYHQFMSYGIFRYANVYGPRQTPEGGAVIANFMHGTVHEGKVNIFGDGLQTRDFVHVDDVARANRMALESSQSFLLNLGSGQPVTVLDLLELFRTISGKPIDAVFGPPRAGDIYASYYDAKRVRDELGWSPLIPMEVGLKALYDLERQGHTL